jgi:hypothetical protein
MVPAPATVLVHARELARVLEDMARQCRMIDEWLRGALLELGSTEEVRRAIEDESP